VTTRQELILVPVLVQVALTLIVLALLAAARRASIRERGQHVDDLGLARDRDWTERALKLSNNFKNQFELPVLFYAAAAFAFAAGVVDPWMLGFAAAFAASRIVHAAIHIGPNIVSLRGPAYLVGYLAVTGMWTLLAVRGLGAGG